MIDSAEEFLKSLNEYNPVFDILDEYEHEYEYTEKQLIDFAEAYHKQQIEKALPREGEIMERAKQYKEEVEGKRSEGYDFTVGVTWVKNYITKKLKHSQS